MSAIVLAFLIIWATLSVITSVRDGENMFRQLANRKKMDFLKMDLCKYVPVGER